LVKNRTSNSLGADESANRGLILYRRGSQEPDRPGEIVVGADIETLAVSPGGENIVERATESLDFLFAADCLAGCAERYAALTNWLRVIRPGGRLLISAPPPDMDALLTQIAHLAEQESGDAANRLILRKRETPLTPTDMQGSPQVQLLTELAAAALELRRDHPDIAILDDILAGGVRERTLVDMSRLYLLYQWLLSTRHVAGACLEVGC
jgi:SAM-dependent methyltransferase